jgi:uncharacterized protein YndB with AHSA1/START domain
MTEIPDRIEREMLLAVPVERVWAALTDPAELVKWFGDGAEIDLRPGGAGLLSFGEGRCPLEIVAVEPMRRFAYHWVPGSGQNEVPVEGNRTLVDFTLEATDGGTRLRMVESGFASIENPAVRSGNVEGWTGELGELESHLLAA